MVFRYNDGQRTHTLYWALTEAHVVVKRDRLTRDVVMALPDTITLDSDMYAALVYHPNKNSEAFLDWCSRAARVDGVEEVRPVFYPSRQAAQARSPNTQMYLTEFVVATLPEGREAQQVAKDHKLDVVEQVAYLPNTFLFKADEPVDVLSIITPLKEKEKCTLVSPQFARAYVSKAVPDDPLFPQQWHLRNTGQAGLRPRHDANVLAAWEVATGKDVVIGIADDGVHCKHLDLTRKCAVALSKSWLANDPSPSPPDATWAHGTNVTGIAAADSNNKIGIAGVAPDAKFAALRMLGRRREAMDVTFVGVIAHTDTNKIQIVNCSWGPPDANSEYPPTLDRVTGALTEAAMVKAVTLGRKGLGIVFVWAAGNGGAYEDNVNYDCDANRPEVIAVGAVNGSGQKAWYSEPGAALLVSAYGGETGAKRENDPHGVLTTDRGDKYVFDQGTSLSAPLVSGVVALMLQVNPTLSYRDVMHILVRSARTTDCDDPDWIRNHAGHDVNHKYGHGVVDAEAAVRLARKWRTVGAAAPVVEGKDAPAAPVAIPDKGMGHLSRTVTVKASRRVEHVEVILRAKHARRGDLRIRLVSPSGTPSVLAEPRRDLGADYVDWRFTSTFCWDERSEGDWTLMIDDAVEGDVGTLESWTLRIRGT